MGKNRILLPKTAQDIDDRVERVLRGLGNPEPPLRLEDVRELLNLDRGFYSANDPGYARETISRIKVATLQVLKRPTLLIDVIKKMELKALYLPDRKRILLSADLPEKKHRWNESHEIGHSILPWHEDVMHGDNQQTLSQDCHAQIEAEANYAAGRMLFLQNRFTNEAQDMAIAFKSVTDLHKKFGNTLSTTFYRFIETVGIEKPIVGLISGHPHVSKRAADFDKTKPCRYFIQSPAFAVMFSRISEIDLFNAVARYCGSQRGGMLGQQDLILFDDNGDEHRFYFETFFNSYDALTWGIHQGAHNTLA